jgi:pyridoxal 5'-phosphate synthase pdxS subunit
MAEAIVKAVTHWSDPEELARIAGGVGAAMHGLEIETIPVEGRLQERGW